jgi:hypothetical protein
VRAHGQLLVLPQRMRCSSSARPAPGLLSGSWFPSRRSGIMVVWRRLPQSSLASFCYSQSLSSSVCSCGRQERTARRTGRCKSVSASAVRRDWVPRSRADKLRCSRLCEECRRVRLSNDEEGWRASRCGHHSRETSERADSRHRGGQPHSCCSSGAQARVAGSVVVVVAKVPRLAGRDQRTAPRATHVTPVNQPLPVPAKLLMARP